MNVNDIGKMILDGNTVEIIMRELQLDRAEVIRLWYTSYTRNRALATLADQLKIDARLCFTELLKERGKSDEEENTHS